MFLTHMSNSLKFIYKKVMPEEVGIHRVHLLKESFMKVQIKEELNLYQTMKELKIQWNKDLIFNNLVKFKIKINKVYFKQQNKVKMIKIKILKRCKKEEECQF
jgi:hypothetical protein